MLSLRFSGDEVDPEFQKGLSKMTNSLPTIPRPIFSMT
jgi:hypothetical protein